MEEALTSVTSVMRRDGRGRYILSTQDVSLSTVDGNYFDQIIGISQVVINKSFEQLFKTAPGVDQIHFAQEGKGQLNCKLDYPQILLQGNTFNAEDVFYKLRIRTGVATFSDGRVLNLDGWVLTVLSPLREVTVSFSDDDSLEGRATTQERMMNAFTGLNGLIPGEYSVKRFFCAISHAKWNDPDDELSTCFDPKTRDRITLSKLKGSGDENRKMVEFLFDLLSAWAKEEAHDSISTLGIKFAPSHSTSTYLATTFTPVLTFTQVYPYKPPVSKYISDAEEQNFGDYNCLLSCENVVGSFPTHDGEKHIFMAHPIPLNPELKYGGNLAQPSSDGREIAGSIVLDYRAFLESFLLPQLQELCYAQNIFVQKPDYRVSGERLIPIYKFLVGVELEGSDPTFSSAASNSYYKFEKKGDSKYEWKQPTSSEDNKDKPLLFAVTTPITPNHPQYGYPAPVSAAYDVRGDSAVRVEWFGGSQLLQVSGEVDFSGGTGEASYKQSFNKPQITLNYHHVQATWSFSIRLVEQDDSVMDLKLEGLGENGLPLDFTIPEADSVPPELKEKVEASLKQHMARAMSVILHNLEDCFESVGKFVYPGHGELKFSNPRFTQNGSVIADVDYRAPSGPDNTISFAQIRKKALKPPTSRPRELVQIPKKARIQQLPRLYWVPQFDYYSDTKTGRLTLTATNQTGDALLFNYIHIDLITCPPSDAKNGGLSLFNGLVWENEAELAHESLNSLASSKPDPGSSESKDRYVCSFNPKGVEDDPQMTIGLNSSGSIEAMLKSKDGGPFCVPHNQYFEVVLQGKVDEIGKYRFEIHESWKKSPSKTSAQGLPFAIKCMVIEITEGGVTGIWDEP